MSHTREAKTNQLTQSSDGISKKNNIVSYNQFILFIWEIVKRIGEMILTD